MNDELDQVGLWVCLWGTVLIMLTNGGRPSPLWASPFPRQGALNCTRVGSQDEYQQASEHVCIHFSRL